MYLISTATITGIVGITASNEYSVSAPVSVVTYPWDMIVEPYRDTTLTLEVCT